MTRVLVIIPAYNEAASLPAVIQDLRAWYPAADPLVVNDGSSDGTATIARQLGVPVLDLPYNLGIGGAVQTGLLYAARERYAYAVQFDGDGQHRADQLAALLAPVIAGRADVAIGSRFLLPHSYHVPLARRCGIAIFKAVNVLIVGQTITDNTSGFRAYGRDALTFLSREYPHDYPEPESVVTLCRNGYRIIEVPTQMRERQGGRSSITLFRSIYYMCKVLLAIGVRATGRRVGRVEDESAHPDYLGSR